MRRSRFSEEQIIGLLHEQEAWMAVAELCRKHGISQPTFYAWKAKFGCMSVSDANRAASAAGDSRARRIVTGWPGRTLKRPGEHSE